VHNRAMKNYTMIQQICDYIFFTPSAPLATFTHEYTVAVYSGETGHCYLCSFYVHIRLGVHVDVHVHVRSHTHTCSRSLSRS
jgi:hypothetical protein